MMRRASLFAALLSLAFIATPAAAHEAGHGGGVAQRLSQPLQPGLDEGVLLVVTLAPGEASPAHRHQAHVFVYMLEGEVLMQVAGGPERRLRPGDVFEEKPDDIHTQARNLSGTAPARFAVFMVKKQGVPVVLPTN
ncbi:MAG: cupin domain-containing protein [Pseudomonadota bacterium]